MWGIGVMTLVGGGLAALLMGDPPDTTGRAGVRRDGDGDRFDLGRALSSRGFVMLYLSSAFCCVGVFVPFVHLVAYSVDQGLGERTGVYLIAAIGATSVIGRVFLTAASDRFGRRNSLAAMYGGMGVGLLLWFVAGLGDGASLPVLVLSVVLFGLGYGGYVAMITPTVAENFGTERIGSILGCFMPRIAIGGFLGPWLAGHAHDRWGSYDVPVLVSGALGLAAGLIAMRMPGRPYAASTFVLENQS